MAKLNKTVITTLQKIEASGRVSREEGEPLLKQDLITVDTENVVDGLAAALLTDAAKAAMPKKKVEAGAAVPPSSFAILTGIKLPESKRGAGRTPGEAKYPFATLEVGQSFFVPVSEAMPDPVKTMGSAVTNATNKYRVDTGKTEQKERTKRGEGNKAVLDENGKKIKETVTVSVYEYPRKFTLRPVKKDVDYGGWKPDSDGAVIQRTK